VTVSDELEVVAVLCEFFLASASSNLGWRLKPDVVDWLDDAFAEEVRPDDVGEVSRRMDSSEASQL
jgi:hypothetical protein